MEQRTKSLPVEERIRASLENLVFALGEAAGADRTRSGLCVPVRSSAGRVSAVLELLNAIDRPRFSTEDEEEIRGLERELSALLGACGSNT